MIVEQFEDKGLAHFSYTIMSEGKIVVIDPARDPHPYYEYANLHDARIVAVIETHPHADFVSSHQEISQIKEAVIYTSKLTGATYLFTPFDDGFTFRVGKVKFEAINTPGHSADSICVLLHDENDQPYALFSGDTLFIGDVGRPDLREVSGQSNTTREALAREMYQSTREKLMPLPDGVLLYPTHGAGSLCGKGISSAHSSSLGAEKISNAALKPMSEEEFVSYLLADQPFIPAYFPFAVALNKKGATEFKSSIDGVPRLQPNCDFEKDALVVDTRPAATFKKGHVPNAINLQDGLKFETWLGSVIKPTEKFYLVAADETALTKVIAKTAKIGYEKNIQGAVINPAGATETSAVIDLAAFKNNPDQFTIIDIRNPGETKEHKIFAQSLAIPLPELRTRLAEIPTDKPIMVHCAGGYRSAAGSSLLARKIKDQPIYDLGEAIQDFN